jgi:hypothetical protein
MNTEDEKGTPAPGEGEEGEEKTLNQDGEEGGEGEGEGDGGEGEGENEGKGLEKLSKEELIKRVQSLGRQKDHWRTKAESGKEGDKGKKPAADKETASANKKYDLSPKDIFALNKADVHEDDLDEILEFAEFKKITVAEALKSGTLKAILSDRAETRKTAAATSKKNVRPGNKKLSSDQILEQAKAGNIPEAGTEEAEDLFWARRGGRPKE